PAVMSPPEKRGGSMRSPVVLLPSPDRQQPPSQVSQGEWGPVWGSGNIKDSKGSNSCAVDCVIVISKLLGLGRAIGSGDEQGAQAGWPGFPGLTNAEWLPANQAALLPKKVEFWDWVLAELSKAVP